MTGDELSAKLDAAVGPLLRDVDEQERYRSLLALAARNKPKKKRGRPPRPDDEVQAKAEVAFMVDLLKRLGRPAEQARQWVFTLTSGGPAMKGVKGGTFRNLRLNDLRVDEHRKRLAAELDLKRAPDARVWDKLLELLDKHHVRGSTRAPHRYDALKRPEL
jgi:hypothetical protein